MTRIKNVFAVSFIAMFAVASVHATIVTQENIVGANGVSVNVPANGQTNAGKVVVTGPTVGNATITIQKNGTAVDSFTANATSNKSINITVPTNAAEIGAVAKNNNITAGTATKITYDAKGLVTGGTTLSASDIPTLAPTKIDGFVQQGSSTDINEDVLGALGEDDSILSGKAVDKAIANRLSSYTGQLTTAEQNISDLTSNKADKATGLTGATKTKITYNSQGIVTGGANLATSDIPSGLVTQGTGISVSRDSSTGVYTVGGSDASTSGKGIIQIATDSDVTTGTNTTKAVTPAQLAKKQDSQIGAAKVSGADSTDKNKAVIVGADGKMTLSSSALGTGAYSAAYSLPNATTSSKGGVIVGNNISVSSGTISVANASTSGKGVIQIASDSDVSTGTDTSKAVTPAQLAKKQDSQIGAAKVSGADSTDKNKAVIVGADGKMTLSSSALASGAYSAAYSLPTASSSTLGGVKIGSNVSINSGTISVADASTSAKGVMKVGTDLKVSSGTVSVDKSTSVASGDTKPVTSGAVYNALSNKQDYAGDFITQGSSTDINEDVIGALSDDETFLSGKAVDKAISYKLSSYSQQVVNLEQNKQPLSSANYQMGNSSGGWTTMSAKQQNMLNGYIPATSQTGTAPTGYALIWVE